MTEIKSLEVGLMPTNCYILYGKGEEAVIVDPGGGYGKVSAFLTEQGKKPVAVLLTHGHFDHILDAARWHSLGLPVYIHTLDVPALADDVINEGQEVGYVITPITDPVPFEDGAELSFGEIKIKVLHTPGHTVGSCCFLLDDNRILSGDTLFLESFGNTGFYGGCYADMEKSVKEILFKLEGDYRVYPGHGESTTMNHERQFNPIL